jgi:hypothetical protein
VESVGCNDVCAFSVVGHGMIPGLGSLHQRREVGKGVRAGNCPVSLSREDVLSSVADCCFVQQLRTVVHVCGVTGFCLPVQCLLDRSSLL